MKVAAVITEYNPFHNGHLYQLETIRQRYGADHIIVIMSGDFIQRGGPAFTDKYLRTRMALLGGADLVIELPTPFATSESSVFARGAVHLLDRLPAQADHGVHVAHGQGGHRQGPRHLHRLQAARLPVQRGALRQAAQQDHRQQPQESASGSQPVIGALGPFAALLLGGEVTGEQFGVIRHHHHPKGRQPAYPQHHPKGLRTSTPHQRRNRGPPSG